MKLSKAKKKIGKLTKKLSRANEIVSSQKITLLEWADELRKWADEEKNLVEKIDHLNKLIAAERQRAQELVSNISALSTANSDLVMENHKLKK